MILRDWINSVNTVSLGSVVNQCLWTVGSLVFTGVAAWLLTRSDGFSDTGVLIRSGSGMRAVGFDLAAALLFAWSGKSAINAVSRYGKSKTAVPYVEAKERGKASASPPAVAVTATDQSTVKIETKPPAVEVVESEDEEHEWRDRNPKSGLG